MVGDSADWFAINHSGVVGKPNHPRWYVTMYRYARDNELSDPAKYRKMKTLLNTAQFSDYILLNWFSGVGDWEGEIGTEGFEFTLPVPDCISAGIRR